MTWLRRVRPALFVLGALLLVVTLVGARALTNANGAADAPKTVNPQPGGQKAGGPIVMGTVDTDPPPVSYGLPPVLQSGTIAAVFVRDGQEVRQGDRLYEFDASLQKRNLEKAQAAVAVARTKVDEANEAKKQRDRNIEVQNQIAETAAREETWRKDTYNLIKGNLEKGYKAETIPEAEWPAKLSLSAELHKANVDWAVAVSQLEAQRAKLASLKAADPEVMVKQAEAGVRLAEAEQATAQTALDLCTIVAKTGGTVEQVKVSPGTTLGVSTRDPALWLIPAGPRIVRAEIEAEFAHRVSDDLKGKEVTIMDHTNPKLTYTGRVLRVGGTFLPKRTEALLANETRVLEAVIEATDPAPAGKPPLRVGQRVRVNLGQ